MEDKKTKYPKVSVILSVYNGEEYLHEAIESVLNQTFVDFEFIIIDDGSTDKSLKIIKSLQKTDNRIVLISRENKGLITSLNEGIEAAKGQYIARMDADDICLPERFEKQVSFMDNNKDIVVCGSWIEIFNKKNRAPYIKKYYTSDKDLKTELLFASPFAHPAVMVRTSTLQENNIRYDLNFLHAEDYQLWSKLSQYGKFANIDKPLLRYRYLEDSITRIADKKEKERSEILGEIYKETMQNIGIELMDKDALIHYQISNNERLKRAEFSAVELSQYLTEILDQAKIDSNINYKLLRALLTKRCFWFFTFKKDYRILNSKYFYIGLLELIKTKVGRRK